MSTERPSEQEVKTSDGRLLKIDVVGAAHGSPVFLLHGTPGSRCGPRPRSSVLYRLGVRLISYDRPGYGGSTRHEGRIVADAANDVATIADALDIKRFAVVGRSGGGPHALACAALLPDRVIRAAVLVCVAPAGAVGLDWYHGMTEINVDEYQAAERNPSSLIERLRLRADRTITDPAGMVRALREHMKESDRRVVGDLAIQRLLTNAYTEALKDGPDGWIDDVLALRSDWKIDLCKITTPVRLWHGAEDNFLPANHTRWLASHIPTSEIQIQIGAAHFGAIQILPQVLAWLTIPRPVDLH